MLAAGAELLEKWETRSFRRDILLSMALAHCGRASEAFDKQAVAAGCALCTAPGGIRYYTGCILGAQDCT